MLQDYSLKARQAAEELLTALNVLHKELDEVGLPHVAARVADYAWGGYAFSNAQGDHLVDALHELSSAAELCEASFMLPSGDELFSQENRSLIRQLMSAANARTALDNGESIRVEELAALARVAEKTVRMATNPSRPGSIRVRKEGHWAFIDASEALAWLQRRDDFQPTRVRGEKADQPLIGDAAGLASACERWRKQKAANIEILAKALRWTVPQSKAYVQIEAGELTDQMTRFPPETLQALGKFLGMPHPEDFARQAFRVLAAQYAEHLSNRQLQSAKHLSHSKAKAR